jgi:GT2 family glycosyltransferase
MKKSLAELAASSTPTSEEVPKQKSFGAFKQVNGTEAVIDLEILRKHNIFFATPCYGGLLTDQYFLSMFRVSQVLMQHGINFRITTLRNESLISRARNILTAMFLDSDCTHLMFIDADIEFQPDDVIRALAYDKAIIAGAYPKKALDIEAIKRGGSGVQYAINFKFVNPETKQVRIENGAIEVLDASTGFFLVKRETIEKMIYAYPELHYRNDSNIDPKLNKYCYNLWDVRLDPQDSRLLSEDYSFCRRWQELGGEIWLDPNTKLNHIGSYTFEGDVSQIIGRK